MSGSEAAAETARSRAARRIVTGRTIPICLVRVKARHDRIKP
jgi:hypothetical protein